MGLSRRQLLNQSTHSRVAYLRASKLHCGPRRWMWHPMQLVPGLANDCPMFLDKLVIEQALHAIEDSLSVRHAKPKIVTVSGDNVTAIVPANTIGPCVVPRGVRFPLIWTQPTTHRTTICRTTTGFQIAE